MAKLEKVLLSPLEVANLLGVDRNTVYLRLSRNQIPGQTKFGGRWFVRRLVLEAWLRGELEVAS